MTQNTNLTAHLFLLLACLAWGGSYAVGRFGLNEGSALWLTLWRWGPGAIVFAAYLAVCRAQVFSDLRQHFVGLAFISLLGVVIYPASLFLAVAHTTALNASLYLAVTPVLIMLLARVFWGERLSPLGTCAVLIGLSGAVVIVFRGDLDALTTFRMAQSDLWAIVSAASWAGYCVALPVKPKALGELPFLATIIVLGSAILIALALLSGDPMPLPQSRSMAWSMVYFAIFPSILAFFLWNWGTLRIGPSTAAPYNNLVPLFGGILGIGMLGETIETYHLVGGGLIICSLVLNTRR
ncbi:DMT family transporter [uncultured Tateyamaria sp.]|uniref:DMT family transporter n=1 Tax=uncultured Tateyamaria sp. TaxID=455651 RepID=UPI00262024F4|nr:DMT family transporter [uncultured Tateyamaria sp.]